jgi:Bacterial Ig-like domain (group 3)/Beta-propeller repeat
MNRICFVCLFLCLTTTFLLSQPSPVPLVNQIVNVAPQMGASQANPKAQTRILDDYGKLPLSFEANNGQTDARVKFLLRTGGYTLFLTSDEAVLALNGSKGKKVLKDGPFLQRAPMAEPKARGGARTTAEPTTAAVVRMKLRNANSAAKVSGVDELAGTSNYFIGNDPAKWRTSVPTYAKVKYEGIYPGIDLVYYGNQRRLEYDFVVAPGADPRQIAFDIRGATRIRRDDHGDLQLKMGEGEIRWHKPVAYQEKDGTRQLVAADYAIVERNSVGFVVADYDASRPLYIDPLIYTTYLGGSGMDAGYGIALDSGGSAYVVGNTCSNDFPTMNPLQPTYGGGSNSTFFCGDAFVTKLSSTGSALVYSTYLGGSAADVGTGIAVDSAGNAYVTGLTFSTDFPTMNPLQAAYGGNGDAFVAKLNLTGSSLVYSTYLGGSEWENTVFGWSGNAAGGIAVDGTGNAYVIGTTASSDFPVTQGAFQTCRFPQFCVIAAFIAKVNPAGSALVYATRLGGGPVNAMPTLGYSIAADNMGNAYVTGNTRAPDFPITSGAFQTVCKGTHCSEAFAAKINPSGSALVYSTYLGGSGGLSSLYGDFGYGIAVDSARDAYVTGLTFSTDFPVTKGAFHTVCGSSCTKAGDAFVSKLNPTGSALVFSSYLGGNGMDLGNGVAVDKAGNAYVTGWTDSANFPLANPLQSWNFVANDVFMTKINAAGIALVYSTYLGGEINNGGTTTNNFGSGVAVDSAGDTYVSGYTDSINFRTNNALQPAYGGGKYDAFVAKVFIAAATTTKVSSSLNPSIYGQVVTFTAVVSSGLGPPPNGEAITFKKGTTVLGTGTLSSGSASFTTSTLTGGTNAIIAVYGGDSNFAASTSKAVRQVVSKATTTTTLASSQNPSNSGQSVTFTASVAPQFSGTVKGTLTFYDGTTALKTASLSGGVAKFTTSTLASGTHSITATYNGNVSFIASSTSLTQTVN